MKRHIVVVYQTVPPQGISHHICRNLAARKIYLHNNIPCVSSALKKYIIIKKKKKKMFYQKIGILIYIFFIVILFIMHILRNSLLRKLNR